MVHLRNRPRPGDSASIKSYIESSVPKAVTPKTNYTRATLDTSSLTSCDTSQWHLSNLPTEDEVVLLRRRVDAHERREEQLNTDAVRIRKELERSKENVLRWKVAVHGDVRPGSHYRKEIVLLKQELDKKDDIIQEREITIDNLMAGNHPSHLFLVQHPESFETSVCSSLVDDVAESPPAREMERLLLENSKYIHRLRERDEEVNEIRKKMAALEQESIGAKQKEEFRTTEKIVRVERLEQTKDTGFTNRNPLFPPEVIHSRKRNKDLSSGRTAASSDSSSSSISFNPFQLTDKQVSSTCQLELANRSSNHSDSIRMTKRIMELHNDLSKSRKEVGSFRYKLEQSHDETKQLRSELSNTRSQSEKIKNMISELNKTKIALHDSEVEIGELKKALDESLVELENASGVVTEQRQTIHDLRKQSNATEKDYLQVQRFLRVETENLEDARRELVKKELNIKELNISKSENDSKMSDIIESFKNKMERKENEIEHLQQDILSSEVRNNDTQTKLVEKETEISEMTLLIKELCSDLEREQNERVEWKDCRANLQEIWVKKHEDLLQKMHRQNIQLHNTDKILLEKEVEKGRLKTLLEELRSKLDVFETEQVALKTKIIKEKDAVIFDLQATRDELECSLKTRLTDQDTMVEDVKTLRKHLEEKARETATLRDTLTINAETIDSQYYRIQKIEQELAEKNGRIAYVELSNIELRAHLENYSVKDAEFSEAKEEYLKFAKQVNNENQSSIKDLESERQTIQHIKKDSIIARLLNPQEESMQPLQDVCIRQAHLQEKLILKDAHILKLKATEKYERNEITEQKCQSLDKDTSNFAGEILRLREILIGENCDIVPLTNYLKMLLDIHTGTGNDATIENTKIYELERARYELVNEFNSLLESSRVLHKKERHLNEKANEPSNRLKIKEENQSLMKIITSMTETSRAELQENDDMCDLISELKIVRNDMEGTEKHELCLEKKIILQSSFLEKLSDSVKAKTAKIADLQKEIVQSQDLMLENSVLRKQNECIKKTFDELSIEVLSLNKKFNNLTIANEDILSLKNELEALKKSENEKVTAYERQLSSLTMNKDVTIDTLRKDLAASRSRSAEEVACLTHELSKMRELNSDLESHCNADAMRTKEQRINVLEHTLYAQEKTVESLRSELHQVQVSMRDVTEQRRRDLEELQKELIESKSRAMNQDREYTCLKLKLDECKMEYEKEIERLKQESPLSKAMSDLEDTNIMLDVKQRLEQLKVVNIELKEENIKLGAKLERALINIQGLEAENDIASEMEKEYANVRKQLKDLECLLEENVRLKNQRHQPKETYCKNGSVPNTSHRVKGKGTEEGSRKIRASWGIRLKGSAAKGRIVTR